MPKTAKDPETNVTNVDSRERSTSMVLHGKPVAHFTDHHQTSEHDDDRRIGDAMLMIDGLDGI